MTPALRHVNDWPVVLPASAPLADLERVAAALQCDLGRRFGQEEGRGGSHARICRAAPPYLTMVSALEEDHGRLLDAVESLRVRIVTGDIGVRAALAAQLAAILEALEEHEDLERYLLRHALD